jgi:hypothetical protein
VGQRTTFDEASSQLGIMNILDFDPTPIGNGSKDLDITGALVKALKTAVPTAHTIPAERVGNQTPVPGLVVEHATTIAFPSLEGGGAYVLLQPVGIPGNKNVRLAASSPFGARIELRQGSEAASATLERGPRHAILSLSGRRAHVFENLIFRGGGVTIGELNRSVGGMTEFRSCVFTEMFDEETKPKRVKWAISTASRLVVGVRVLGCQFLQTDSGVGVLHSGCDNWIIGDNSTFVRMRGVGVEIHSSGVTVRDARFEDKLSGGGPSPYIRVTGTVGFDGGLSEITGCRFGGEVGEELEAPEDPENPAEPPNDEQLLDGPPRHAIELGPNDPSDVPIAGVMITRNRFLGRTRPDRKEFPNAVGGPTPTSAAHAISLQAPVRHTIVAHNHFHRYFKALVEETSDSLLTFREPPPQAEHKPHGPLKSHSNLFVGNAIERQPIPNTDDRGFQGVFSEGGQPWQQLGNGEQ